MGILFLIGYVMIHDLSSARVLNSHETDRVTDM